ncbi:MAG: hypothetical protein DME26_12665, partial [Verrucomicrobia bacterium]
MSAIGVAWLLCFSLGSPRVFAADVEDAQKQFIAGDYTNCIRVCEQAVGARDASEEWKLLLAQSLLTVGRYTNALAVISSALAQHASSVRVRLLAYDVLRQNGRTDDAKRVLDEINNLAGSRMWAYRSAPDLVALGKTALLLGADPRRVLENFFDRAKKGPPDYREAYLASGQLALDKHDYNLAAKAFLEGLKRFPKDADMHFGLAQAYVSGDRSEMVQALEAALNLNPRHVPSLLLVVDHSIDAEEYKTAEETLEKILAVNPWHPEAWAYRAMLARLHNDAQGEAQARERAFHFWSTNPNVDHLIGLKLSQKYRFAEGAPLQRRALSFDQEFLPAKLQLAQDLLRLGEETEGWRLADEVYQRDAYDATSYNLVTLHDSFRKFQALTNADFIVRMSASEAAIYGRRVMDLLLRAKQRLCQKYEMPLDKPVIVEIFPEQKDFAVRTFGMPGNPGYLGVCFGSVITANSPASQAAHPANWQAVLWHEFCHVVTLQMTRNKMPRWLSEGISVYEEVQANPTWGQAMTPKYREMVLGGELTPVGKLSAAFLTPKTDLHLQFAYYESSLVVQFLVERFGLESLKKILRDLATGAEINEAIATHTAPLEKIEKDFAEFARDRARKLAPRLDWDEPKLPESANQGRRKPARPSPPVVLDDGWAAQHTNNFYALSHRARKLLGEKKWEEAKAPLNNLIELYPEQTGADSAYALLAEAHRGLNETNQEREVLSKLASRDADALNAYLRLMELSSTTADWPAVVLNAERYIAVNPLVPQPFRYLARGSEALDHKPAAIDAYTTLLQLDPPDPAEVHFRLARLQHQA